MSLLKDLAPILGRLGGDIDSLLAVLEPTATKMRADANRFAREVDADDCSVQALPLLLRMVGWSTPITLTERQQRGLIKATYTIYSLKGTRKGLADALRVTLGIDPTIVVYATDGWVLGVSELSADTYLAADLTSANAMRFTVLFPRTLTDQERQAAITIIEFMKPQFTSYDIEEAAA